MLPVHCGCAEWSSPQNRITAWCSDHLGGSQGGPDDLTPTASLVYSAGKSCAWGFLCTRFVLHSVKQHSEYKFQILTACEKKTLMILQSLHRGFLACAHVRLSSDFSQSGIIRNQPDHIILPDCLSAVLTRTNRVPTYWDSTTPGKGYGVAAGWVGLRSEAGLAGFCEYRRLVLVQKLSLSHDLMLRCWGDLSI